MDEELEKMKEKTEKGVKNVIEAKDDDFEEKIVKKSKETPVLVDFWAPWCMPCETLGTVLEELAEERDDFVLAKVNVDDANSTARKYGIRSIPNVKLFADGEIKAESIGAKAKKVMESWLDKNL